MNNPLSPLFWSKFWKIDAEHILRVAAEMALVIISFLVVRLIVFRLMDSFLDRMQRIERHRHVTDERIRQLQTLQGLGKSLILYLLIFVFGVLFLKTIGLDIVPFVTTASVIGLAVGIGSQKLVKDVISGFFIIIDDFYVVGEIVTIGGLTGRVEEIGMRITRLVDTNGKVYLISNGDIGIVTNLSRNPVEDYIELNIAASANLNQTIELINAECFKLYEKKEHFLKAAPKVIGITAFTVSSVTLRISVTTNPESLIEEQMRVRAAIREALVEVNIPLS